ncbi:MAG: glycosyltransferase [Bacteroidetes bacterium]|nr:glycosyltransferase [Bacteroidota bacterium]
MIYPPVTVLTLMYNTNPKYIIEAIESVQRNNYPNLEHIIMDDCSPDQNPSIEVENWIKENNYNCRFIRNPVNQGVSKNLNQIISIAKGKYLIGCCDDVLADDRILKDVEIFEQLSDDYAIIFGFSQSMDAESRLLPKMSPNMPVVENENYFKELSERGNFISGPAVTMRKEALRAIGGYGENLIVEDYDMWMRLSNAGYKFKLRPAILIYYRELKGGLSSHPRITLDVLKIKSKFPNRIPLKSVFDQEIQNLLNNKETEKLKQVISLYKECFPSYKFIRLFDMVHFTFFQSNLLSLKLLIGKSVLRLNSYFK